MAWTNPVGIVLLILSVPLLLLALILLFSEEPFTEDLRLAGDRSEGVYGAVGAASLLMGVVLMMMKPRASKPTPRPAPAEPRTIEIKRTEMNIGTRAAPTAASPQAGLQAELDDVNRRIARLKVQYGMGDVSKESFRRLMDELEQRKADVELRLLDAPS